MLGYKFSDSTKKHNEILKVIAIVAMVIDHVGFVLFGNNEIMRIIGRLAFPIFAYQVAQGYFYTSNQKKYMFRLWIFALISQIPYTLLFETFDLNILFTLIMALLLIDRIHKGEYYFLLLFIPLSIVLPIDYGVYGVLTPVIFYVFRDEKLKGLIGHILLTILYVNVPMFDIWYIQYFGIVGVLICLYFPINRFKIHLNKYFFYWFYPGHLAVLFAVKWVIIFYYLS